MHEGERERGLLCSWSMRRLSVPRFVVATVLSLLLAIAGFWGYQTAQTQGLDVARLSQTKAKMHDTTCVFVADFHLASALGQGLFAVHKEGIRAELIRVLRTKSKYMVESPSARKGLQLQMANVANRLAGRRIADKVTFDRFTLM